MYEIVKKVVTKMYEIVKKVVTKMYEIVNTMSRTNSYQKAHRVLARVLSANKKSLPVNSEDFKQVLRNEPTVYLLKKAKDQMLLVAVWEVTPYISKLTTLGPIYRKDAHKKNQAGIAVQQEDQDLGSRVQQEVHAGIACLLYTSPSPRD